MNTFFEFIKSSKKIKDGKIKPNKKKYSKGSVQKMKWEITRVRALINVAKILLGGEEQLEDFLIDNYISEEKIEERFESELEGIKNLDLMMSNLGTTKPDGSLSDTLPTDQVQNVKTTIVSCFQHVGHTRVKFLFPKTQVGQGTFKSAEEHAKSGTFDLYRNRKVISSNLLL